MSNNSQYNPHTGDIISIHMPFEWYKPWRLFSVVIRVFQGIRHGRWSWASHTAIIIIENGIPMVYEANPDVKRSFLEDWVKDKEVSISRIPERFFNAFKDSETIKETAKSCLNTKYNYMGLIVWRPIFMITGVWLGPKDNARIYCSEFISKIIDLNYYIPMMSYQTNPAKIYRAMKIFEVYFGKANEITKFTAK